MEPPSESLASAMRMASSTNSTEREWSDLGSPLVCGAMSLITTSRGGTLPALKVN
eukprot:CAMPEP_0197883524 /NCGR_PEP_ID=MMETSP1439-20131203/10327_1 /TAXON_ID=66791 /ORGANISM="Gonyaulax spinifera, Strain CCMP409" /LENGTH=54 /DNA_ID=CAMNT_0043503247 /DNA_START=220 /DNA_END=381 /DNA_ORIENTATION=+